MFRHLLVHMVSIENVYANCLGLVPTQICRVLHFFPLTGILRNTTWTISNGARPIFSTMKISIRTWSWKPDLEQQKIEITCTWDLENWILKLHTSMIWHSVSSVMKLSSVSAHVLCLPIAITFNIILFLL